MSSKESIFPMRNSVDTNPSPETLSLDDAGDVVDALTAETARTLIEQLYKEPATASDLATSTETSIQNVQYHLDRLREVGLIEVVDTWYSEKGREMEVYGPKSDPMMIIAGDPESQAEIKGEMSAWH